MMMNKDHLTVKKQQKLLLNELFDKSLIGHDLYEDIIKNQDIKISFFFRSLCHSIITMTLLHLFAFLSFALVFFPSMLFVYCCSCKKKTNLDIYLLTKYSIFSVLSFQYCTTIFLLSFYS